MVKPARKAQSRGKQASAKRFIGLVVAIIIVGAGVLGYSVTRKGDSEVTTVDPNLPAGVAEGYLLGKPDAPVQVAAFADFECPACGTFALLVEPDLRTRFIDTGIIAYRFFDFPLPMHKNTWSASNAAACASDQGKFWEMHDLLFSTQDRWNTVATSSPKKVLQGLAEQLGLDVKAWEDCFDSRKHYPRIMANKQEAERRVVQQTPSFVIGDKMVAGAISFDQFKVYVEEALKASPKPAAPAPAAAAAPATKGAER